MLVTGAPGWLGSRLARRLLDSGRRVRCLVYRDDWSKTAALEVLAGAELVFGDVRHPGAVAAALRDVGTVFHLAAARHPRTVRDYTSVNVDGTRQLASAAERLGVEHVVFVSSLSVHGHNSDPNVAFDEASPLAPKTAYAESKRDAEQVLLSTIVPTTILRPGPFYGPGQTEGMARLMRLVARGAVPVFRGALDRRRSYVHVDNVVEALLLAERREPLGGALLIGDARPHSTSELIEAMAAALGVTLRLVSIPLGLSRIAELGARLSHRAWGRHLGFLDMAGELGRDAFGRIDAARRVLGYAPMLTLADGMTQAARGV